MTAKIMMQFVLYSLMQEAGNRFLLRSIWRQVAEGLVAKVDPRTNALRR